MYFLRYIVSKKVCWTRKNTLKSGAQWDSRYWKFSTKPILRSNARQTGIMGISLTLIKTTFSKIKTLQVILICQNVSLQQNSHCKRNLYLNLHLLAHISDRYIGRKGHIGISQFSDFFSFVSGPVSPTLFA